MEVRYEVNNQMIYNFRMKSYSTRSDVTERTNETSVCYESFVCVCVNDVWCAQYLFSLLC